MGDLKKQISGEALDKKEALKKEEEWDKDIPGVLARWSTKGISVCQLRLC